LKAERPARWLLEEPFATERDGLLFATERVFALSWAGLVAPVVDP
jgi:hypothetical protein